MTLATLPPEIRKNKMDEAYAVIHEKLEYLVLATPTGKAREDLTTARIMVERAYRTQGRTRA